MPANLEAPFQADDATPYIAMGYLDGRTVLEALKACEALPVGACAEISR